MSFGSSFQKDILFQKVVKYIQTQVEGNEEFVSIETDEKTGKISIILKNGIQDPELFFKISCLIK